MNEHLIHIGYFLLGFFVYYLIDLRDKELESKKKENC